MAKRRKASARRRVNPLVPPLVPRKPANYTKPGSVATTKAEVARRLRLGQVPVLDDEGQPTGQTEYGSDPRERWPYREQDTSEIAGKFRAAYESDETP